MKVILNQAVPKLGKEGQVVSVADGYARNFLFPRGLAVLADKGQLATLEKRQARVAAKSAETLSGAEKQKEKLDGKTIRIQGKVGRDTGRLFGAITAQDVADAIKDQLKVDVERKRIALVQPIKRLGHFELDLDLHHDVDAKIHVEVFDPEAPVVEAAPEPPQASAEPSSEEPVPVEA